MKTARVTRITRRLPANRTRAVVLPAAKGVTGKHGLSPTSVWPVPNVPLTWPVPNVPPNVPATWPVPNVPLTWPVPNVGPLTWPVPNVLQRSLQRSPNVRPTVAHKHYLTVTDEHFDSASKTGDSLGMQPPVLPRREAQEKTRTYHQVRENACFSAVVGMLENARIAAEGLEPPTRGL